MVMKQKSQSLSAPKSKRGLPALRANRVRAMCRQGGPAEASPAVDGTPRSAALLKSPERSARAFCVFGPTAPHVSLSMGMRAQHYGTLSAPA